MAVTMTEIAREAGVSLSLVSRLLRNDKTLKVAPATRERVLAVQQQLGAVHGRTARPQACHVVVPINRANASSEAALLSEYPVCRQFEEALQARGGHLSMAFFDADDRHAAFEAWMDRPQYCDGLLLLGGVIDEEVAQLLTSRPFPHISIDPDARRFPVNTIHSDQFGAYLQIVNHLKAFGHRRIAFVGPRQWWRYSFFGAAMLAERLPVSDELFCELPREVCPRGRSAEPWQRFTREVFSGWLQTPPTFTAVCCNNDWVALGVIDVLRERGLTPGRDISVVGYDNFEVWDTSYAAASPPILTTIDHSPVATGRRAAERILDQIAGHTEAVHEAMPVRLIVRDTTGPAREP